MTDLLKDLDSQRALAVAADTVMRLEQAGYTATSAKKFVETGEIKALRKAQPLGATMNINGTITGDRKEVKDAVAYAVAFAKKRGRGGQ